MKTTNIKNNCIVKIKIMNNIQCIKIHRNHACVIIYLFKNTKSKIIKKQNGKSIVLFFYHSISHMTCVTVIGRYTKEMVSITLTVSGS